MTDNVLTGAYRKEPAWHGIGMVFNDPLQVDEAMELAGIGGELSLGPVYTKIGDEEYMLPKKRTVIRSPMVADPYHRVFGVVGKNYKLLQYSTIAEILNPLTKHWPLETLGLLHNGERLFVTLKMEDSFPMGDENERTEHYFFLADDHMGKGSLSVVVTNVRVVCENTWYAGFNSRTSLMSFSHSGRPEDLLRMRVQIEEKVLMQRANAVTQFERMMKFMLVKEQLNQIIIAAYPDPSKSRLVRLADESFEKKVWIDYDKEQYSLDMRDYGNAVDRAEKWRGETADLLVKFNDEFPAYANTVYAALNAVNEHADFRKGKNEKNLPIQVLMGNRAKVKGRAQKMAYTLMNKN